MTSGTPTALRAEFQAVTSGVEPTEAAGRRVSMLVHTTDLSLGRGDPFVAAGLGRQLARLGLGVRLVPRERWYSTDYADDELLVAFLPSIDVRRLPARVPVMAWIRNMAEEWRTLPGLESFAALLASSELSRDLIAERFRGPVGVLPIGFDEDLFVSAPDDHPRHRLAVSSANHWGTDRHVHLALRHLAADVPLDWYGVDRSRDRLMSRFNRGTVDYFLLPEIYRNAVLTVDDVNDVAVGWGNHNSRLFEALASGSLVVTNTPLGLRELGLERVPVYRSPEDLAVLIGRAATGEFGALAGELHDVVRARHSFRARAASFVEFATEHDLWHVPERPARVVNFFPDWTSTNPYQRMLYERLPDDVRLVPSANPVTAPVLRDDGGDLSGQVLHVHWQNVMLQPSRNHAEATRRLREITETYTDLVDRGVQLIWTIHNRLPHELNYYFHEIELCRFLARTAHVVHVLSEQTFDAVQDLFELDPEKVVVVEHGSYTGVYPELLDRATARARLKILPSERVALFFGGVRPYKGLEQLLEAFERIHRAEPATRLLLVGQPGRTMSKDFLKRLERLPFVTTEFGFVPESDVHLYFRAADLQVAPYAAVLNSGSVLLGLGFGLPVVAPRLGALCSLAEEPFMFPYRARNVPDLERALSSGLEQSRDPSLTEQAVAYARRFTGTDMSEAFVRDVLGRVFEPVVGRPAAVDRRTAFGAINRQLAADERG